MEQALAGVVPTAITTCPGPQLCLRGVLGTEEDFSRGVTRGRMLMAEGIVCEAKSQRCYQRAVIKRL